MGFFEYKNSNNFSLHFFPPVISLNTNSSLRVEEESNNTRNIDNDTDLLDVEEKNESFSSCIFVNPPEHEASSSSLLASLSSISSISSSSPVSLSSSPSSPSSSHTYLQCEELNSRFFDFSSSSAASSVSLSPPCLPPVYKYNASVFSASPSPTFLEIPIKDNYNMNVSENTNNNYIDEFAQNCNTSSPAPPCLSVSSSNQSLLSLSSSASNGCIECMMNMNMNKQNLDSNNIKMSCMCENNEDNCVGCKGKKKKAGAYIILNDVWKERLKFLESYFDVQTILTLKQTAKVFYKHKYKPYNNILSFTCFKGYESRLIIDKVLSNICKSVHTSIRDNLKLDFRECTLMKDTALAKLVDLSYGVRANNVLLANIHTLNFDYCYQITDKGLSALLTTHLPYLEELSLCSARNKQLTGAPFTTYLSVHTWPLFTKFSCSFTNMWLHSLTFVADFCMQRANQLNKKPHLEIFGSWASKCLFEKLGLGSMSKTFCRAVKGKDHQLASKLTKTMQKELLEIGNREEWSENALVQLVKNYGSELLVNAPLTIDTSEDGGVNVWTLPISIAIQTQDHDTFNLLIKRGAKVDVCDYLGKSPIFRACEVDREDFVEVLLSQGASPIPHDLSGPSPLHIAIKHKNTHVVNLLLKHGAVLDCKCPAIRAYKSALYVACEVNAPEIIQLFLESGADPNWNANNKYTPTLLAYQINSAWLPHFLEANAGFGNKRWVLTEIMSCAIMKCDIQSVMILIKKYKDLLHKTHPMWSKPHIQAAKLGKFEILEYLLGAGGEVNAGGLDGQTALHAATEEGYIDCVKLLLCKNADINKTNFDGQAPIHIACLENRLEVGECLLRKGCDVNHKDKALGETPLMTCIRMRNEKMALLILSIACNQQCDAVGAQGRTALMYAMFFGQYSVADKLMEKGADVTIKDHQGNSPYSVVCERMLTPGSDKKVLRRYLRLYRASGRRHSSSNISTIKANNNNNNLCTPFSSVNKNADIYLSSMVNTRAYSSPVPSTVLNCEGVIDTHIDQSCEIGNNKIHHCNDYRLRNNEDISGGGVEKCATAEKGGSVNSSLVKAGKKLKLEPKAVLSAAKGLPIAILKAVKAK